MSSEDASSASDYTMSMSEVGLSTADSGESLERVSKLGIGSLLLALFSCIAIIAPGFMIVCWLAAILAAVAAVRIVFSHELGGLKIALAGVVVAVMAGCWTVTASVQREKYLFETAGQFGETYLQLLTEGKKYEAMELRKQESDRQVTGTSLDRVYTQEGTADFENMNIFMGKPSTKAVIDSGPNAEWVLKEGLRATDLDEFVTEVVVRFENRNSDQDPSIDITLMRATGLIMDQPDAALWNVKDHAIGEESEIELASRP